MSVWKAQFSETRQEYKALFSRDPQKRSCFTVPQSSLEGESFNHTWLFFFPTPNLISHHSLLSAGAELLGFFIRKSSTVLMRCIRFSSFNRLRSDECVCRRQGRRSHKAASCMICHHGEELLRVTHCFAAAGKQKWEKWVIFHLFPLMFCCSLPPPITRCSSCQPVWLTAATRSFYSCCDPPPLCLALKRQSYQQTPASVWQGPLWTIQQIQSSFICTNLPLEARQKIKNKKIYIYIQFLRVWYWFITEKQAKR